MKGSSEVERGGKAGARSLASRRIVVTRAREQSEELARRLRESGAEAVFLPTVRFADPQDTSALDQAILKLEEFDWIVFTSANAARFFLKRCAQMKKNVVGGRARIAAVGPATRAAVEAEGLRAILVPGESNGEALAGALAAEVGGKKVLLPRSDLASSEMPEALRAAGAKVTEVVTYRTAEPDNLDSAARSALLDAQADAVTFFSPSAFHHLARALGDRALHEVAARTAFAAVGPVTAAAIRDAGFEVAVAAREATNAAVVAALDRYFAEHSMKKRAAQKSATRNGHRPEEKGQKERRVRKGSQNVSD